MSGATGIPIYSLEGTELENVFGRGVCGLGDVDNDGVGDFAIGAPHDDALAVNGGRHLVYSGAVKGTCSLELLGTPSVSTTPRLAHMGCPGVPSLILADVSPGPVAIPPLAVVQLGLTPALTVVNDSAGILGPPLGLPLDTQGLFVLGPITLPSSIVGASIYLQAFAVTTDAPNGFFQISNGLPLTFVP